MKRAPYVALLAVLVLAACGDPTMTDDYYSSRDARQAQVVTYGVVADVRDVTVDEKASGVGALGGGAAGGIAGSTLGKGSGSALGAVAGAVVGGIAGNAIDSNIHKQNGQEITVKLDTGATIAVAQEISAKQKRFAVGEKVKVLNAPNGTTRITR